MISKKNANRKTAVAPPNLTRLGLETAILDPKAVKLGGAGVKLRFDKEV
ncbi:hypothetical protein [Enterococcus hulanensis]|nr:hypothetical protein [Enterococcus hulanensis]